MNRSNFRGQAPGVRPSLTGGPGYTDAAVRPRAFRMQEPGSNIPVRPTISSGGTTHEAGTVSSTDASTSNNAAAASAAFTEHPRVDPATQCYDESSWWSPVMQQLGAMGYDDGYHEGTYQGFGSGSGSGWLCQPLPNSWVG